MEPHTSDAPADPPPSSSLRQTRTQDPSGPRPSSFPFLAPAQSPDEVGRLGGFRLLRLLGEGGMGIVFEAEDSRLGRRVAVKVMKPDAARNEEGRRRFLRKARAAAAVEHDHVVPIHHVDEDGGTPYLVMPLLRGESLDARLRKRPRLPAAEAVRIAREAAEGLEAAHAAGLVHRDVKPSNLWLEETPHGERVKVLDFGLARPMEVEEELTGYGAFLGTAGYTSPEQARGEALDGRADLFSLGCVLYRMLTGQPPFQGKTLSAVVRQVETHNPPSPHEMDSSVPAELSDLTMRLLSKAPSGRPASAREAAEALRVIEGSLLTAAPAAVATGKAAKADGAEASTTADKARPTKRLRRRSVLTCAVSITLTFCLLVAAGISLVNYNQGGKYRPPPFIASPPPHDTITPPPKPSAWKGYIDVVIFDPTDPKRQNVHLGDPDVLPLKPGDRITVEAQLDQPGYCYILWIDADGSVDPVYPWKPGHWDERPAEEQPVLRPPDRSATIHESVPGMETLVLLVRDAPLPRDVDLRKELGPIRPQVQQTLYATVWFENGEVVKGEPGRSAAGWDEAKVDDPVRATQEQIRSRLGPGKDKLFQYTRAVSFADRGK